MYKFKKVWMILLAVTLLAVLDIKTYAVTPQYKPPQTDFTIDDIADIVKNYLKENPVDIAINKKDWPKITKSIYYHKKLFFNKSRLQVEWEKVKKAKSYKIKIIKQNGKTKTYKTTCNSLFIYEKTDNFIVGCIKGGRVKVRAIKNDGSKSEWSKAETISCNSLHCY